MTYSINQLKKIGQLDQRLKQGEINQEQYDAERERILAEPDMPDPEVLARGKKILRVFGIVLLVGIFAVGLYIGRQKGKEADRQVVMPKPSEESHFDPDIRQSTHMLTVVNRDELDYDGCELTINDRYKAKVPRVKPADTFIVPYQQLVDEDGKMFSSATDRIVEVEFYCKDYDGHNDILSLER